MVCAGGASYQPIAASLSDRLVEDDPHCGGEIETPGLCAHRDAEAVGGIAGKQIVGQAPGLRAEEKYVTRREFCAPERALGPGRQHPDPSSCCLDPEVVEGDVALILDVFPVVHASATGGGVVEGEAQSPD